MRSGNLLVVSSVALALAGCGGAPAANEVRVDNDGGGKFSGSAGMQWTEQELRAEVGDQVCGGTAPREFSLRALDVAWIFSGTC